MSVEDPASEVAPGVEPTTAPGELPTPTYEQRRAAEPQAHGAAVVNVLADADDSYGLHDRGTLYEQAISWWREHVGDRDSEPYVVDTGDVDLAAACDLPPARFDRDYVLVVTSSRWKAGTGRGDDYRAYYEQHLKLRERDADGELHKPPTALHVEIMPQFADMVYQDGSALECPYGEGTRIVGWTTWADSGEAVEQRMYAALAAVYGDDAVRPETRVDDSRRIAKAEAHVRFDIGYKRQVVNALEDSKRLIAYGGETELEAHQRRQREGWLEAEVRADRWHLLGFDVPREQNVGMKVYQASNWANYSREQPAHHPKLEAFFAGVDDGPLPHVSEWDETLETLRSMVSAHLEWSGVDREQLVADDYFAGPDAPAYQYRHPAGRREQLAEAYEQITTEVYREALKANTEAVYDLLRAVAVEGGATYDVLEDKTGLARSTIRYHARRLEQSGVVERVGNPVLVVYPTLDVLEQAEDILREIKPDETDADREERAEQRRERRERRDDARADDDAHQEGSDDGDDDVQLVGDTPDGRGRGSSATVDGDRDAGAVDPAVWHGLDELALGGERLGIALERGYVAEADVRVNVAPYDWLDGG